jgi:pSer/pThr/pTyr-binding forkhead associated (FHA) protein
MASLCLLREDGAMAERWELGEQPVAVGRDDSANVIIDDDTLSRRHFLIKREGDAYYLEDLASRNGTWVDGKPAKKTKLRHHDCILAGRTIFLFSEQRPVKSNGKSAIESRV